MRNIAEKRAIVNSMLSVAPVQTVPLARMLGLEVYHTDAWTDDISGMILKSKDFGGESGYAIYVNAKHHVSRRRFTTAHEIAHYVLHEDQIGDGITDDALYRSELSGPIEAQANRYAADILMPWTLINQAMDSGLKSVADLAAHFQVSKSAMSIRLGVPY